MVRAETQHDAPLGVIDDVDPREGPDRSERAPIRCHQARVQPLAAASGAAPTAAEQAREPTLKIAHYGIEISRTLVPVRPPWIALVAVVPSHRNSHFRSNAVR